MEPNKYFDEQIKRAMENLERDYDPGSWAALNQRLDANDAGDLDAQLKERLGGFEAAPLPGSWAAMQQRIEAEEAAEMIESEAEVDNLAYEKLHDFQVPFQDHHWALMARRLEEEFSLRHKLYRYKVMEVALMALLLLTIVRFLPYADGMLWPESGTEQPAVHFQTPQDAPAPAIAPQAVLPKNQPAETQTTTADAAESGTLTTSNLTIGNSANASGEVSNMILENDLGSEGLNQSRSERTVAAIPAPDLSTLAIAQGGVGRVEQLAAQQLRHSQGLVSAGAKTKMIAPGLLALADAVPVQSEFSWEELPTLKTNLLAQAKDLRFSIFTTTDVNYIVTPPDQLSVLDTTVTTNSRRALAAGYGGGILVSLKKDKLEFQTGGIYSFKRYLPNTPAFLFETLNYYVKEDFNGIQLDVLQVPVNLSYHFKDAGKWRFYGTAGAAGHFITSSVYEIEYERTPTFNLMAPPSSPDDTRSIRQEKEFPEGLADGGELYDNFYLSANLGFGVERYLSPKWVLFFQPTHQYYLRSQGVGTNRDKIYTTSFYFGTKFSLK